MNTKDFLDINKNPMIIKAILSNPDIYNMINEEFDTKINEYQKNILDSRFLKSNEHFIFIDNFEYAMKLVGILLSPKNLLFLDKVIQKGWYKLYDYIYKSNSKICLDYLFDYLKQVPDIDNIIIILIISNILNKEILVSIDEERNRVYNNILEIIGESNGNIFSNFNEENKIKVENFIRKINLNKGIKNNFKNETFINEFSTLCTIVEINNINLIELSKNITQISEDDKKIINLYVDDYYLDNDGQYKNININNIARLVTFSRFINILSKKCFSLYKEKAKLYKQTIVNEIEFNKKSNQLTNLNKEINNDNKKLRNELKILNEKLYKIRKELVKNLRKDDAFEESKKLKLKIDELNNKINKLSDINEILNESIKTLLEDSQYINETDISDDALTGVKGVIIGGFAQWQQHMRKIVPHFKFIETDQLNYDIQILKNIDKIYFNTAYNSHSMFLKTVNFARKNDIEMVYINSNSISEAEKLFA